MNAYRFDGKSGGITSMARIFLSYSHCDKAFVAKLAGDLRAGGHEVWLDAWKIEVGDSIPSKIEQGIHDSDFVAVVLSKASCCSNWVEREWKQKYWAEVKENEVLVLPILLEDCEIPELLKPKLYADFRDNYSNGFHKLSNKLGNPDSVRLEQILTAVAFLVDNLLSDPELSHLRKVYDGSGQPETRFFKEELGRLCAMRFLREKANKSIRDMNAASDLRDFVEIRSRGKQYLELRQELLRRTDGLFAL